MLAVGIGGLLALRFFHEFEQGLIDRGIALCHAQAETERAALASRLDQVQHEADATIAKLQSDHEFRLQTIAEADKQKPTVVRTCTINVAPARKVQ